jgi:hypothetical protein
MKEKREIMGRRADGMKANKEGLAENLFVARAVELDRSKGTVKRWNGKGESDGTRQERRGEEEKASEWGRSVEGRSAGRALPLSAGI